MVHFLYGRETIPFIGSMEFKSTEFKTNSKKTYYTNKNIMMVLQKINHLESFNSFFNYINSFKLIMMRIVKSQLEKTIKEYQYIIEGRLYKYPCDNIVHILWFNKVHLYEDIDQLILLTCNCYI